MSEFGNKMLKIAGLVTALGLGGAVMKKPAENIENSDKNAKEKITQTINDAPKETIIVEKPLVKNSNDIEKTEENKLTIGFEKAYKETQIEKLTKELSKMNFGQLLEKDVVDESFLANYQYTIDDVKEMRSNVGADALRVASFKKNKSGKNFGMCLGGVKEVFRNVLGVKISCEKNRFGDEIKAASKAQLNEVKALFCMGNYSIDAEVKGNISREVMKQCGNIVTQFDKGKEGWQGHIGYVCFIGSTQYEYSDGRQFAASSLRKLGNYYGKQVKVYAFKSTKVPKDMARFIAEKYYEKKNYLAMVSDNVLERIGVETSTESMLLSENNVSPENAERIKKAKAKVENKEHNNNNKASNIAENKYVQMNYGSRLLAEKQ